MRKIILLLFLFPFVIIAQTTLYFEDFGNTSSVSLPYSYGTNSTGNANKNAEISNTPSWTSSLSSGNLNGYNNSSASGCMSGSLIIAGPITFTSTFQVANGFVPTSATYYYRLSSTGANSCKITISGTNGNSTNNTQSSLTNNGAYQTNGSISFSSAPIVSGTITVSFEFSGGLAASTARLDNVSLIGYIKPSITSSLSASSTYGSVLGNSTYTITANNSPTSFNATSLPTGMSINTSTGVLTVSNTTAPGTYNITISATNPAGTDSKTLVYTVNDCTVSGLSGTISGLTEQCTDVANWTYYGDASNKYFAIKKNGNTFNATVDVTVNSGSAPYTSTSSNGANQEHGSYLMGRYWNASLTSGSISAPVDVRFYYSPSDTASANTARNTAYTTLVGSNSSTLAVKNTKMEWFKTVGAAFNPSAFTGNKITGSYIKLTPTYGVQNSVNYAEFTGITSFSGGTGGFSYGPQGSSGNSLPVTWAGVSVSSTLEGNQIKWNTASEHNAHYFQVEYSYDGVQFIALNDKIIAAGTSQKLLTYSYIHRIHSDKMIYYRIKQVDFENNQSDYSKTVFIQGSSKSIDANIFQVYPTNLSDEDKSFISIKSIEPISGDVNIDILDFQGKSIMRNIEKVEDNTLFSSKLNLSHLKNGVYLFRISNGGSNQIQRIVK